MRGTRTNRWAPRGAKGWIRRLVRPLARCIILRSEKRVCLALSYSSGVYVFLPSPLFGSRRGRVLNNDNGADGNGGQVAGGRRCT